MIKPQITKLIVKLPVSFYIWLRTWRLLDFSAPTVVRAIPLQKKSLIPTISQRGSTPFF